MLLLLARHFVRHDPPIGTIFAVGALSLLLVLSLEALLPPSILLLSSSSAGANRLLASLNAALPQYRTVALLRPPQSSAPAQRRPFDVSQWNDMIIGSMGGMEQDDLRRFFFNNLRTENSFAWRSVVFHLMDVVPLIVIDATENTEPIREEQARILRRGYVSRTLVVESGPNTKDSTNALRAETVDRDFLPHRARGRLRSVSDQAERQVRQREYSNMLAGIDRRVRYCSDLVLQVIKSRIIGEYETRRFICECKSISPSEAMGRRLERIPSRVGRQAEIQFLKDSRGWEEVESILNGVSDAIANESGEVAEFNRGNVENSLGAAASAQCRWDDAIRYIDKAIRRLTPLTALNSVGIDAKKEIATAYFNLAEVYAGRHFDDHIAADLEQARIFAERCLATEREAGFKTTQTNALVAQLRSDSVSGST